MKAGALLRAWYAGLWGLMAWGLYATVRVLAEGLQVTGMNDVFPFGLWIAADLAVIALGAAAFMTGLFGHLLARPFPAFAPLRPLLPLAVALGFACYTAAIWLLVIDLGQPLRAWFVFRYPNAVSMLTEVTFCISLYTVVLSVELGGAALEQPGLSGRPWAARLGPILLAATGALAALGTLLSVFHQGSLGGMFGVLFGRPFAFRGGVFIWPWTFFLFVLSAAAGGAAFLALVARAAETCLGRAALPGAAYAVLGRLAGWALAAYLLARGLDTAGWLAGPAARAGFGFSDFYPGGLAGWWLLAVELGLCGALPAALLLSPRLRARRALLFPALALVCLGVVVNRFSVTLQTLALPVLPFQRLAAYAPTWSETAVTLGALAYGALVVTIAARRFPPFSGARGEAGEGPP